MIQITVISGKGGTGKTSLTGAFAALEPHSVLADCDVDAANLHLLICDGGSPSESEPFLSGAKAVVDPSVCTGCGWCGSACRFEAIHLNGPRGPGGNPTAFVNPLLCEGCGTCHNGCPAAAVELVENQAGELLVTLSRFGALVHARLNPGEGASGKLVAKVRTGARAIAEGHSAELVLIDGPPGIGCPVIASITGVDGVLIVTEPTISGRSDLRRVLELCKHFGLPAFVLINKYDLNEEVTKSIQEECFADGVPMIGKLRFDPVFVDAMIAGRTVMEFHAGETARQISRIWARFQNMLSKVEAAV